MQNETMGMIIAKRRKELGMTQLELAQQMGVTDKAVSKWERDLSCPDIHSLPKLAELFGMNMDELMRIKTETVPPVKEKSIRGLLAFILRAVCLAMGIAVIVLTVLEQLNTNSAILMLGIGIACAGVSLLEKN